MVRGGTCGHGRGGCGQCRAAAGGGWGEVSGVFGGAAGVGVCAVPGGAGGGGGGAGASAAGAVLGAGRGGGRTHVLLPVTCLLRRADEVEVIGSALVKAAGGLGHRRIARDLGRFPETVRGWLRRFGGRAEAVRVFFTVLVVRVAVEPVLPDPAGSVLGDAVAAIEAAAGSVASRFEVGAVTVWQVASAVSAGALLAPGWPPSHREWINTSSP
jgi:hypothetical protein